MMAPTRLVNGLSQQPFCEPLSFETKEAVEDHFVVAAFVRTEQQVVQVPR